MVHFESPGGATPIDPDEMEGLKIKHITTRDELNRFEQDSINEALQWLENRRKGDILTEKFVKTLHQRMFSKVWKWAGAFRTSGKNIGVDWHQISTQLHTLLGDARYWIEHRTYPEDEIAARFHHKLVWVHPFINGNGRHARLITDILLKEELNQEPFTWNIRRMNIEDQVRDLYLGALRKADGGDYSALLDFVRADWKDG